MTITRSHRSGLCRALPMVAPSGCTRRPGENYNYSLGYGPCDCGPCVTARADTRETGHTAELTAALDTEGML